MAALSVPPLRRPGLRGLPFSTRMLLQQLLVIVLVVALATVVYGWLTYQRLSVEIGSKSLAVAQSLSADQGIRAALSSAGSDPVDPSALLTGPVQQLAETVRLRTDALFVVVTDRAGIRWSHPNPAELGRKVSTSPEAALNGQEITVQEVGTLGPSVRSKVPVRSLDDQSIVGEVSVGYSMQDVTDSLRSSALPILGIGMAALLLGAAGASLLSRRLRVHTLGLEPEEIGALVQDQEVVLHGVAEGVLGVAPDRRVTVCNAKALRLLNVGGAVGRPLADLGLPDSVVRLLDSEADGGPDNVQVVIDQAVLIVTARKVVRAKHDLGWVLMVRDRTDVQALSKQLDAVGTLTTALRAQRHEFANRLHTVSGLLEIGHPLEAADYLRQTLAAGPLKYPLENSALLADTYLQAFLGAKSAQAAEKGVRLRIGAATALHSAVSDAQNVTTVLGNLVDNALTAAAVGSNADRCVEIELLSDGAALHIAVADSGDGVHEEDVALLFTEGYSTARSAVSGAGLGEGLGLALSRQIARLNGGDVWLVSTGTARIGSTAPAGSAAGAWSTTETESGGTGAGSATETESGGTGAVFAARLERVLEGGRRVHG
ncbi:sensor histidine kinase [Paenarthrobacter sp. Z7-10]|uniref:sensor histidine kinase n=1 Tax=Paenarthrobacter sp. Z7-10 TaxID=2787635 RepID=UPI0022A8DA37|nr:sensor histidine kinase [Paenarthrobacter sp. Z7-10]MCZ2404740.1 sensor histidine kinase [Paenarthrobacter sp. Z7-10]